jgi:hypothetical protein
MMFFERVNGVSLILTRFQPGDGGGQFGILNRFNGFLITPVA